MPLTSPRHEIEKLPGAIPLEGPAQLIGLPANDPERVPRLILTALSVEVQSRSFPFTDVEVTPPDSVRGVEKWIFADNAEVTAPGPSPANFGSLVAADDAVVIAPVHAADTTTTTAKPTRHRFIESLISRSPHIGNLVDAGTLPTPGSGKVASSIVMKSPVTLARLVCAISDQIATGHGRPRTRRTFALVAEGNPSVGPATSASQM